MTNNKKRVNLARLQPSRTGYVAYEARKRQWDSANPGATPAERDAAMMRLARECGV